jgi:CHRD domain
MNALRRVVLSFPLFALAASAGAQDLFGAGLIGGKAVPPTASTAAGRGWFDLDPDTRKLRCRVETDAAATAVEVRLGANGDVGTLIDSLQAAEPSAWEGVTPSLSKEEVAELRDGHVHVVVYTAQFPLGSSGGEIRDQLTRSHARILAATVNDDDVPPPASSSSHGLAQARLRLPERVVTYDVIVFGLDDPSPTAQLRLALPGETGSALFSLALQSSTSFPPNVHTWSGTSPVLSKSDCEAILDGEACVSVSTHEFPTGEVRGQLQPQTQMLVARPNALPFPVTSTVRTKLIPNSNFLPWAGTWTLLVLSPQFEIESGEPGVSPTFATSLPQMFLLPLSWLGGTALLPGSFVDDAWDGKLFVTTSAAVPWSGNFHDHLRPNPTLLGWPGPTSDGPLGRLMRIGAVGDGTVGEDLVVTVHGAASHAPLSLSIETSFPPALPVPFNLGNLGAPGNRLWVSPDLAFPATASATGSGEAVIPIPSDPSLFGVALRFQWIGIEPAANPTGIVVSDAMRVVLIPAFGP